MKAYDIIEVQKNDQFIILANSYNNPFDELEEIETDLNQAKYTGSVIFDLLLCNGVGSNRYIEMHFDGKQFDDNSIKVINNLNEFLKEKISSYLRTHPEYIQNSILPNAQSYLMLKGEML